MKPCLPPVVRTMETRVTKSHQKSGHSLHAHVFRSLKRTHDMFLSEEGCLPPLDEEALKVKTSIKAKDEYGLVMEASKISKKLKEQQNLPLPLPPSGPLTTPASQPLHMLTSSSGATSLPTNAQEMNSAPNAVSHVAANPFSQDNVKSLLPRKAPTMPKPQWHPPWKLYRVISGHTGWVRCVNVEPGNEWFCTGAADRIIKIWDMDSGKLKLSLTGHVSAVRAVKVSVRQPYLFSAGEDKMVKCWDLEYNKVWDMRTKAQVHCLTGHTNTVASVKCQAAKPQVITGSHDSTIRLWDLAAGKYHCTLTHHKKSVRALCLHPTMYMFASASPYNVKQWKCPDGEFVQNLTGHNAIVNALTVNPDGVLISGGDNGSLNFWDWKTGFCFQKYESKPQPGSIDSEAGIFDLCYDQSGCRLITTEADKTIKMFKEDETALLLTLSIVTADDKCVGPFSRFLKCMLVQVDSRFETYQQEASSHVQGSIKTCFNSISCAAPDFHNANVDYFLSEPWSGRVKKLLNVLENLDPKVQQCMIDYFKAQASKSALTCIQQYGTPDIQDFEMPPWPTTKSLDISKL